MITHAAFAFFLKDDKIFNSTRLVIFCAAIVQIYEIDIFCTVQIFCKSEKLFICCYGAKTILLLPYSLGIQCFGVLTVQVLLWRIVHFRHGSWFSKLVHHDRTQIYALV